MKTLLNFLIYYVHFLLTIYMAHLQIFRLGNEKGHINRDLF